MCYVKAVYLLLNPFDFRVYNYLGVAEGQYSWEARSEMSSVYFLVLVIIWHKQTLAPRTEDHRLTFSLWLTRLTIRYHRLFVAKNPRTVAYLPFHDLILHFLHPFWSLDELLMKLNKYLDALLVDLLLVSHIFVVVSLVKFLFPFCFLVFI